MENLARAFDQPVDSQEHQDLSTTVWLGSELVSMRYWLGRLVQHNLFRVSDDDVKVELRNYFLHMGCQAGAELASCFESWSSAVVLLQNQVEVEVEGGLQPTHKRSVVAAIRAILSDPELSNTKIAELSMTTEKQIARMSDITVLRKLWKLRTA